MASGSFSLRFPSITLSAATCDPYHRHDDEPGLPVLQDLPRRCRVPSPWRVMLEPRSRAAARTNGRTPMYLTVLGDGSHLATPAVNVDADVDRQ
jgi:hypothetical protein